MENILSRYSLKMLLWKSYDNIQNLQNKQIL